MKQIIRRNMFETNSSSTHVLVLDKKFYREGIDLELLKMIIDPKEIDSAYEFSSMDGSTLCSIPEIICYFWVAIRYKQELGESWATIAEDNLKKWCPRCTFVDFDTDDFYINHQSCDLDFVKKVVKDKKLFKKVLSSGAILLTMDLCGFNEDDYEDFMYPDNYYYEDKD